MEEFPIILLELPSYVLSLGKVWIMKHSDIGLKELLMADILQPIKHPLYLCKMIIVFWKIWDTFNFFSFCEICEGPVLFVLNMSVFNCFIILVNVIMIWNFLWPVTFCYFCIDGQDEFDVLVWWNIYIVY